jgi:hypothetical protein
MIPLDRVASRSRCLAPRIGSTQILKPQLKNPECGLTATASSSGEWVPAKYSTRTNPRFSATASLSLPLGNLRLPLSAVGRGLGAEQGLLPPRPHVDEDAEED